VVEVVVGVVKSGGRYARAELVIKAGGRQAKFSVELSYTVKIQFNSSNREAAEEAAAVLKEAGVEAELKNYWDKSVNREKWYIKASIDKLAAARKELREAIAQVVRQAEEAGLLSREKAQSWLQKLLRMRFSALLDSRGALRVMYKSTSPLAVEYAAERLQRLGLRPGVHYRAKKPQGGRRGWVAITPEGLRHLAYLAAQAQDEQIRTEATQLLQQVKEAAEGETRRRLEEEIEAGRSRGAAKLTGLKIGDVAIHEARAWIEKEQLRIWIRAEVRRRAAPEDNHLHPRRQRRSQRLRLRPRRRARRTRRRRPQGEDPDNSRHRPRAHGRREARRRHHAEAHTTPPRSPHEIRRNTPGSREVATKNKEGTPHLLNTSNPTSRRGSATAVRRRTAS
jgi:hypothetical protein